MYGPEDAPIHHSAPARAEYCRRWMVDADYRVVEVRCSYSWRATCTWRDDMTLTISERGRAKYYIQQYAKNLALMHAGKRELVEMYFRDEETDEDVIDYIEARLAYWMHKLLTDGERP